MLSPLASGLLLFWLEVALQAEGRARLEAWVRPWAGSGSGHSSGPRAAAEQQQGQLQQRCPGPQRGASLMGKVYRSCGAARAHESESQQGSNSQGSQYALLRAL